MMHVRVEFDYENDETESIETVQQEVSEIVRDMFAYWPKSNEEIKVS